MKLKILLAALILSSNTAFAAHTCGGKITTVDIGSNGALHITVDTIGVGNLVCSISRKVGTIEVDTCKALHSMVLAASMANKNVTLWFNKDDNKDCRKGEWIDLQDHGFYFLRISS
ncbi:MAG TPA: hypothetical protein ENH88_17055 [Pseudoalteromonas prydzensis]|uniref:Uncharacterized protein n=1 Tax=Pseudoalteromonas prydzensis TaxID=182141 RepID=A0A7V1GFX7_9GAMM|nr:hypothetical protein [Pseudoalteromonas prydzensis]HEA18114.1 hypothetical protein [Pseudoalteromonas prydzensis]